MHRAHLLVAGKLFDISCLHNEVREFQENWFNVMLKDTSAGQTLADSVDPAEAAGRQTPLLALMWWSMEGLEEGLLMLTSDPQEPLPVWICAYKKRKGGVRTAAQDTASDDNCHCDTLKYFDSCKHPPLESLIKIKLVSCAP